MISVSQHELKKLFLGIRDKLAADYNLDEKELSALHVSMINAMLESLLPDPHINLNFESIGKERIKTTLNELGSLAENFQHNPGVIASLLELKPEIIQSEAKLSEKYGEKHDRKRQSGRFFTPSHIADFMSEQLVEAYINQNGKDFDNFNLLDPSVGGGIFLDSTIRALELCGLSPEKIADKIHAVDLDPDSIEIARKIVSIKTGRNISGTQSFHVGDFLLDCINAPSDGFSCIIGNPPYISFYSRESSVDSERVKRRYIERFSEIAGGNVNTFIYFIARGIELLRDDGFLCFIVPDKILWNRRYSRIRKYILEKASPVAIYRAGEKVFSGATVGSVILLLQKNRPASQKCRIADLSLHKGKLVQSNIINVKPSEFLEDKTVRFITHDKLLEKLTKDCISLSEIAHVRDGINPAFAEFRESVISNRREKSTYRPLIEGADITPFKLTPRMLFINYDPSIVTPELQKRGVSFREQWIFETNPKLVNRQTSSKLIFALDTGSHCSLNSVHNTILRENFQCNFSFKMGNTQKTRDQVTMYLLCLLNSRLMNFIYQSRTQETSLAFPQVHIADLKELPIRIPDQDSLKAIASLGSKLTKPKYISFEYLDSLDTLVFDLYDVQHRDRIKIISQTGDEWRVR